MIFEYRKYVQVLTLALGTLAGVEVARAAACSCEMTVKDLHDLAREDCGDDNLKPVFVCDARGQGSYYLMNVSGKVSCRLACGREKGVRDSWFPPIGGDGG